MSRQVTVSPPLYVFWSAVLAVFVVGSGCQEVEQPSTTLTTQQWKELEDKYIISGDEEKPDPEYAVNAEYGNRIKFLGYDIDGPLVAGEQVTFTWYWKALKDIDKNWKIFIHFDSQNQSASAAQRRQNLDHHPLQSQYEGYRTSRWRKGDIIRDVQKVKIRQDYPPGKAIPYIGFYRGSKRLPITNTDEIHPPIQVTNDNRVRVHTHRVKSGEVTTPSYTVSSVDVSEEAEVDGALDEQFWQTLDPLTLEAMGNNSSFTSEVFVGRADERLWVGAHLEDEHIWAEKSERDARLWEEEVFEMFIDANGDSKNYLELQINPNGAIFDANFEVRPGSGDLSREERIEKAKAFNLEELESAVSVDGTVGDDSDTDNAWSVEMSIPWESLPGVDSAPSSGSTWAANFYRFDRPSQGTTHAFAWSTAARGDFHQVGKFGTLAFAGNGEAESSEQTEESADKESGSDEESAEQGSESGSKSQKKVPKIDPGALKRLKEIQNQ